MEIIFKYFCSTQKAKIMHLALPQKTMTKENLAKWLTENSIESKVHEEKVDYTKEEIAAFEHDSSVASRAIDRLQDLLDSFKSAVNDGNLEPKDFTVPETKGLKVLKANREFADGQIEIGHRIIPTDLYGIPCSSNGKICFFDIEANHFEQHDYKMNPFQQEKYGAPLFTEEEPLV